MNNNDYYSILEIDNTATDEDIKRSYRKLSLKYHPDRNSSPDAANKFQQINEAHEILSNKQKRGLYDMEQQGFMQNMFPGPGFAVFHANIDPEDLDIGNLFQLFGDIGTKPITPKNKKLNFNELNNMMNDFMTNINKPSSILTTLDLTLEEVYYGGDFLVHFERTTTSFGFKTQESHSISVHVNPGIEDGEIIVIKNEGNKLSSNKIGDVEVEINYKQHPYFEKEKNNLIYKKQLTLKEALCGFNFTMKHLNGREISLNNKENPVVIQNGCKKEIPKMGIKDIHNEIGNLIIEFNVVFPTNLSKEQISNLASIL